jgi:hypothetical protein
LRKPSMPTIEKLQIMKNTTKTSSRKSGTCDVGVCVCVCVCVCVRVCVCARARVCV